MFSIRRLVVSGLDSSAKQILRCLSEYIDVAVVLSKNEELAAEFVGHGDVEGAKQFWSIYLKAHKNKKQISQKFQEIMRPLISDSGIQEMLVFEAQEEAILNAVVHPSLVGGQMILMSGVMDSDTITWPPYFGCQTSFSIRTIKYAIYKLIFLVALMDFSEFCQNLPSANNDYTDEQANAYQVLVQHLTDHVLYGQSFLLKLGALSLSNTKKGEFGYPDFPNFFEED